VRVVEHESETIEWIFRIERNIRPAGLENAEERDHHLDTAAEAYTHEDAGPHPKVLKIVGELIRPQIELRVRQLLVTAHHRHRVRARRRLSLHQLVETRSVRVFERRIVPLDE
jgi:hypothetical protein